MTETSVSTISVSLMMCRCSSGSKGKGKRKASPSPIPSSGEEDSTPDHLQSRPSTKRFRLSSPAHVKQAALTKVVSKSKASYSSKGMAGFATLINNANLLAVHTEMNHGLCPGSSSSRGGGPSAKPKAGKMVCQSILLVC